MEEINVHKAKASGFLLLKHSWENSMIMLSFMQANSFKSGQFFLQKPAAHGSYLFVCTFSMHIFTPALQYFPVQIKDAWINNNTEIITNSDKTIKPELKQLQYFICRI